MSTGPAGSTDTGNTCADLTSDGRCVTTPITPVTLASKVLWPVKIAVDAASVYWVDYSTIDSTFPGDMMKVGLNGGAPVMLASDQVNASDIRVDATGVYWPAHTTLWTLTPGGTTQNLGAMATTPYNISTHLGLGGGKVYWAHAEVDAMPYFGGALVTVASGAPYVNQPVAFAADAASIYWLNTDGSVAQRALAGGSPVIIVPAAGGSDGAIAVDAKSVYYSSGASGGQLAKVPIGGGTPVVLATQFALGIAVDATHVYYTYSAQAGAVMRVPIGGGTPEVVAADQPYPQDIAVDATNVYWSNLGPGLGAGSIMKMTKP